MPNITVYDKVSWHYPEGRNCPSLEAAKTHFLAIMKWLKDNQLLTPEGEEIFELGVDANFSITSSMLTRNGNDIFNKLYSLWLKNIDYSAGIDFKILNDGLQDFTEN